MPVKLSLALTVALAAANFALPMAASAGTIVRDHRGDTTVYLKPSPTGRGSVNGPCTLWGGDGKCKHPGVTVRDHRN